MRPSWDAAKAPLIDAPSQGCTTATVIGPCFCAALISCSYLSFLAEGTSRRENHRILFHLYHSHADLCAARRSRYVLPLSKALIYVNRA